MFAFTIPVLLSLAFLLSAAALPATLEERAGPSGSVVLPVGDTEYTYTPGEVMQAYPNAGIRFVYNLVYEPSVQTESLDLYLSPLPGLTLTGATYQIANGTQGFNTSVVDYTFGYPENACGSFNLVVIEHQIYNGQLISFQSAAPKIVIDCQTPVTLPVGSPYGGGALSLPAGGTTYNNDRGVGGILVQYATDRFANAGNTNTQTSYISLELQPTDSNGDEISGTSYTIAPQLVAGLPYGEDDVFIEHKFAPPAGACGYYRLIVTEYQPLISFRSAAPLIEIFCAA